MYHYPADIYTEPGPDTDTLANLGPLTGMAGIWTSADGMDARPVRAVSPHRSQPAAQDRRAHTQSDGPRPPLVARNP